MARRADIDLVLTARMAALDAALCMFEDPDEAETMQRAERIEQWLLRDLVTTPTDYLTTDVVSLRSKHG